MMLRGVNASLRFRALKPSSLQERIAQVEVREAALPAHPKRMLPKRDAVAPITELDRSLGCAHEQNDRRKTERYTRDAPTNRQTPATPHNGNENSDERHVGVAIGPRGVPNLNQPYDRH